MGLIMNCLDEKNEVTVGGNVFSFAPRQIKHFYNENISALIGRYKAEYGFVSLPEELEYLAHLKPTAKLEDAVEEAHKPILEEKRKEGIENYCRRLRALVYNAQVSLRMDLEKMNIKADPKVFASDGDLKNMEQLLKYQAKREDESQKRVDKMKELEKQLNLINKG